MFRTQVSSCQTLSVNWSPRRGRHATWVRGRGHREGQPRKLMVLLSSRGKGRMKERMRTIGQCLLACEWLCHLASYNWSRTELKQTKPNGDWAKAWLYLATHNVTIRARTSRAAYSPVMTTVLRRRHLILVMDSRLSQQSSITCTIMTHS